MKSPKKKSTFLTNGFVEIRGARQNNLKSIDVDIPRNALVVFTGISGSGKSSLAFDTIYAEAQRRYFESVAPYARRLIAQLPASNVTEILGLPPAVALEQRRGEANSRSSVGTITTLSNSLRMLFSRAGNYPDNMTDRLDSDAFSPNTPKGACEQCHGTGMVHDVTEESLVPDPSLTIREKAIAAWPGAWQGKNYRDILDTLGYDVDIPFKNLSKKDRRWILFTEEKPVVTVHAIREAHRIQRPYQGTYMSAASYVRHTYATTQSATLRKRVAQFMESSICPQCKGKRLKKQSLSVLFSGYDIADLGKISFNRLQMILQDYQKSTRDSSSSKTEVANLIVEDLLNRIDLISKVGLHYLSLDRSSPTLSQGEMQRLRLITQLRSGLFGVVYVLDEPSAGLHPADTEALMEMLFELKSKGNSLFIVEHDLEIIRQADWIVDIGPGAGVEGGQLLYSGPVKGLEQSPESLTKCYLFGNAKDPDKKNDTKANSLDRTVILNQGNPNKMKPVNSAPSIKGQETWLKLKGINQNNLIDLDVEFPLGRLTAVTGVSGAGKSTLVTKVLADTIYRHLGMGSTTNDKETEDGVECLEDALFDQNETNGSNGPIEVEGLDSITRIVSVDQKPIGRTPRSNLATYTGLFDHIRKLYNAQELSKKRKYKAGRFSFNVEGGRCTVCEGEGFISIELLFLPSVYAPCSSCHGKRYNAETLEVTYQNFNIAQVLDMSVTEALETFKDLSPVFRALTTLNDFGLGYLKLGQPATELSGGEAQRIKLSTELKRLQKGSTLYLLDEPTTGLHPYDVDRLMSQLRKLVEAGNTVIVVEHDLDVIASCDWVIDLGPGAGDLGGKVVASGTPEKVALSKNSPTAPYLKKRLQRLLQN